VRLEPVLASRLALLAGVDSWDDPRVEEFSLPACPWQRPAVDVTDAAAGDRHAVPIRVYRPSRTERARGALLWVHGGGFTGGSIDMPESDYVAAELAARAGVVVVAVDYRLVDAEIHYPLPVDDVLDAWTWLTTRSESLAVDGPICLGGASAGGCLTVSATLRLRDDGGAMPRALLLGYPALHAVLPPLPPEQERELAAPPTLFRFDAADVYEMFERYLGGPPAEIADGYAVPALADLRGLPPTLIVTSEYDRLRASGESFADALADAGVDVECVCEPGTLHGHLNTIGLVGAEASLNRMTSFLDRGALPARCRVPPL
jgi:acetyl esterase